MSKDFENDAPIDNEEWEPGREVKFRIVAESSLGENEICENHPIEKYILNEFIKIKSGVYDNIVTGFVVSVERIPEDTEETSV